MTSMEEINKCIATILNNQYDTKHSLQFIMSDTIEKIFAIWALSLALISYVVYNYRFEKYVLYLIRTVRYIYDIYLDTVYASETGTLYSPSTTPSSDSFERRISEATVYAPSNIDNDDVEVLYRRPEPPSPRTVYRTTRSGKVYGQFEAPQGPNYLTREVITLIKDISNHHLYSTVAVHITALRVPAIVRNGSQTGALLDCEYALGAREQRRLASEMGLVVKWFLVGSGPAPVYQWIPGQRPQDFGALRGKVDLAFKVTGSDGRGEHRALRITTLTTDLSGEYKCSVSTFEDEDFMVKKMLVFSPEKSLELGQYKPKENIVNITCFARGVYPEPKLAIFWSGEEHGAGEVSQRALIPLEGVSTRSTFRRGAYDVIASKTLNDGELPSPTIFNCQLRVAEADYVVRKSMVYYPNGSDPAWSSAAGTYWVGSSVIRIAATLVAVLIIPLTLGNLFVQVPVPRGDSVPKVALRKRAPLVTAKSSEYRTQNGLAEFRGP